MKKPKAAFTLIEIMVVLALIGIIVIMLARIDFNYMSDRQKSEQFANKVISLIETARNDQLIGRMHGDKLYNETGLLLLNNFDYYSNGKKYNLITELDDTLNFMNFKNIYFGDETGYQVYDFSCNNSVKNSDLKISIFFQNQGVNIYSSEHGECKGNLTFITSYKNSHKFKITFDPVSLLVTKEYLVN